MNPYVDKANYQAQAPAVSSLGYNTTADVKERESASQLNTIMRGLADLEELCAHLEAITERIVGPRPATPQTGAGRVDGAVPSNVPLRLKIDRASERMQVIQQRIHEALSALDSFA